MRVVVCVRRLLRELVDEMPRSSDAETSVLTLMLKEIHTMSDSFESEMTQLRADVAAQSSVSATATAAFRGITAQLVTAEAAAKNAGATDAQIAGVATLRQGLEANTSALASAVPANTASVPSLPAAPAPSLPAAPAPSLPAAPAPSLPAAPAPSLPAAPATASESTTPVTPASATPASAVAVTPAQG